VDHDWGHNLGTLDLNLKTGLVTHEPEQSKSNRFFLVGYVFFSANTHALIHHRQGSNLDLHLPSLKGLVHDHVGCHHDLLTANTPSMNN
jgi:hypothetical protein